MQQNRNLSDLLEFISLIILNFPAVKERKVANKNNTIEYINQHYMEKISPKDIAKNFNISYSQLYKICKTNFMMSPKQIITTHRIRNAVDRLLMTDDSIKVITSKIGYTDEFLFSKTFSKAMGYSPSKFRNLDKATLSKLMFK